MKPENQRNSRRRIHGAYFISVVSITMVLLVFGYTVLLLVNGRSLSNYIKENIGFTVYLTDDAADAEIRRLEKFLTAQDYAHSVRYISKDDATAIMREELGNEIEMLPDENIFPASIEVGLKTGYASPDSIDAIRKSLAKYTALSEFYYQKSMAELINRNLRKMSIAGFSFTALFIIITASLINNTVRLSIYSKRLLLRTAKLLGAENSFIRRPFVTNAVVSGLFAGSLASLILVSSVILMRDNFSEILHIEGEYIATVAVIIFGMLIAGLSAQLAADRYIRSDSDAIFFEN